MKHGSIATYTIGFVLSLILTLIAYGAVEIHRNSGHTILSLELVIPLILSLAVLQLFVQLIFFLHVGIDKKNPWNLIFLTSTVSIILIVILASLWIMYHLNYNMMPQEIPHYIMDKEGIYK
jgi:cytochrome o ubiquinol oxidase operon protein cyoD